MKSHLKSVGRVFLSSWIGLILVGCSSIPKESGLVSDDAATFDDRPATKVESELSQEISLKADRSELDELRKEIPEEKRKANDELALLTQLLNEVRLAPSVVQQRYQEVVRKRRDTFRKKVTRLREDFSKHERKRREEFLKTAKDERLDFMKRRHERDETRDFFSAQEARRRDFFDQERDRRKEFESEIQAQSRDFESYVRERNNEFQEQARIYSKRYHEKQKEEREGKKTFGKSESELRKPPAQLLTPEGP